MRSLALRFALLVLLGTLWSGCGDALSLLPAQFENRVDSAVTLFAVSDTPVTLPSAYVIASRSAVRLDQVSTFDFVYNVAPTGERFFIPLGALINTGSSVGLPGFRLATLPFFAIPIAEQQGYVTRDSISIYPGQVLYVRSSVDGSCSLGIPYYA